MRPRLFLPLLILLCAFNISFAQNDSIGVHHNPYNVIYNHLYYLQADSYEPEKAAESFPDSFEKRVSLSKKLKQILDGKGLFLDLNRIPTSPDYRDSVSNESIYILDKSTPQIYLEKIDDQWFYSRTTIQEIPALHKKIYPFGTEFVTRFHAPVWQYKILGIKLWKWLGIIITLFLAQLLFLIVRSVSRFVISNFVKRRIEITEEVKKFLFKLSRVIALLISIRFILFLLPMFQISPHLNSNIIKTLNVLSIFFIIIGLKFILKIFFVYFERVTEKTESTLDDQLLPVLLKLSLIILWALGIVYILNYLGVNVTALLAGISIGGLALALAAQDTVKNFFGSIMIFLDKPFQIGDLVEFSGVIGTVEEVGVRSTRIRTTINSLTYVPNAHIADSVVNNLGLRVFRRYNTTLGVTYDTPADTIEVFVENIRKIIEMHPGTFKENYEVHLNAFADSSLNILINVFFETQVWSEELQYRHQLMIAIIKMAEALGVRFAFPTQTLHIEELPNLGGNNTPPYPSKDTSEKNRQLVLDEIEAYFNSKVKT